MTGTGAAGSTAAEIAATLHLKGPAAFPASAISSAPSPPSRPPLRRATPNRPRSRSPTGSSSSRDSRLSRPSSPAFSSTSAPLRKPSTSPATRQAPSTRSTAGSNDHTKGLIPRILDSLPEGMALALANAVYLDADWEHPFKKGDTGPGVFHKAAGKTTVDFMHQTESLRYGTGPGYRAVALPYRSSTLSLLVVLAGAPAARLPSASPRWQGSGPDRARPLGEVGDPQPAPLPPEHRSRTDRRPEEARHADSVQRSRGLLPHHDAVPLKIAFVKHAADFTVDEKGPSLLRRRSSGWSRPRRRRPRATRSHSTPTALSLLPARRQDRRGPLRWTTDRSGFSRRLKFDKCRFAAWPAAAAPLAVAASRRRCATARARSAQSRSGPSAVVAAYISLSRFHRVLHFCFNRCP